MNKLNNLVYKLSFTIGVLILIFAIPLAFNLYISVSYENGPIENTQVYILIFSCIYNLILCYKSSDHQVRYFHLWCSILLMLMSLREISYGRVFYPLTPFRMSPEGPLFIPMANFVWRNEFYTLIAVLIVILIWLLIKKISLKRLIKCRLPIIILATIFIAFIFSYIGDHGMIVGKRVGQIIEEFGELAFYCLIPALCIHYNRKM